VTTEIRRSIKLKQKSNVSETSAFPPPLYPSTRPKVVIPRIMRGNEETPFEDSPLLPASSRKVVTFDPSQGYVSDSGIHYGNPKVMNYHVNRYLDDFLYG
jgi:hypothetical protein